ncbi:MAG: DUF4350 domain-containing protein [Nonlabens sp.]
MIDKRSKIILYVLLAVVVLLFIVESTRPRPVVWKESYTSGDKIPFACYILYDQLEHLFPNQEIESVDLTPRDFLVEHEDETNANYIFINNYIGFDKVEAEYLIDFASRGNKVFVATKGIAGFLADSLGLKNNSNYTTYDKETRDTVTVSLSNKNFSKNRFKYERGSVYRYFTAYDTLNTKTLGEIEIKRNAANFVEEFVESDDNSDEDDDELTSEDVPQVNFVEVTVGEGAIYYNLNPIAFTNYYLLDHEKAAYVSGALSYLNDGTVYFDDYGKSGRRVVTSPLRFILSDPSLRLAYYVALVLVLLYLIVGSKRRQRIIPLIKPLKNDTVEFTKTIGSMYYESGDYSSIVNKKIQFFLSKIRSVHFLNTENLDGQFIKKLSSKSGVSEKKTADLINFINELRQKPFHKEFELKRLACKIDAFLNHKSHG